jgi:5-methylcytosine-specific restriction protein A
MPAAPKTYHPPGYSPRQQEQAWASRRNGSHALYNLWAWRKTNGIREQQLEEKSLCEECLLHGITEEATDVDHVVPHKGDMDAFLNGELRSLCHPCHSRKTMREQRLGSFTGSSRR